MATIFPYLVSFFISPLKKVYYHPKNYIIFFDYITKADVSQGIKCCFLKNVIMIYCFL